MKRKILLGILLAASWLLWSGHYSELFLCLLGATSVLTVIWLAHRMQITDNEGAPIGLGFRSIGYAIWLAKEIVEANIVVTRLILDPELPIRPRMIRTKASQKTDFGRVVLANSITLTPGTVSVDIQGDRILVHALSLAEAEEDLSGDMDRRVCELEERG